MFRMRMPTANGKISIHSVVCTEALWRCHCPFVLIPGVVWIESFDRCIIHCVVVLQCLDVLLCIIRAIGLGPPLDTVIVEIN